AATLPVLFGDNIGTTITAVLASIGTSIAAKRTALTHVIFNLIGAIIVLIAFQPFLQLISFLAFELVLYRPMTIAFSLGIFNVSNAIIQFPFIAILAIIVTKLVPGDDYQVEYKPKHLDPLFVGQSPAIALDQAKKEILRMAEFAEKGLLEVGKYLEDGHR